MTREATIAARLAAKWHLDLLEALPGATCSYVVAARGSSGQELVLKIPEAQAEERYSTAVVAAFSGNGGVDLLDHDPATGATLLRRLMPGANLASVGLTDSAAQDICAGLIQRFRTAPSADGIPLETFFADFRPKDELGQAALTIANHLFATTTVRRTLHGDLHHFNILQDGTDWLAIDPKGIVGDPAYEVAAFMRNPVGEELSSAKLRARLLRFAELLRDPADRLWGWSFAQTVRSYDWCEEDGDFHTAWRATAASLWELRSEFS